MDKYIDLILKLPKLHRWLILGAVALLLIVVYWVLLFRGHAHTITQQNAMLTTTQHELDEQRVVLADLPRFRKETEEMKNKRQEALKQLPNKNELDKLFGDISLNAVESGLDIVLFKPQPEIGKNFYAEIPVDIKLLGTYHDMALFFDKIANLSRIVNISDLIIDKAKEVSGRNVLDITCKATTYKFIEEKSGEQAKTKSAKKK
jgi:type IV pilus assembly protein PilO